MDTGSFELLKQRSGGRDGIVYVARDPVQGVTVDLRMLTGLAENAGRMADLQRRLQLLKLVNNPGILNCVDAVLQGDSPFVATEPAPEQSLLNRGSQAFQREPIGNRLRAAPLAKRFNAVPIVAVPIVAKQVITAAVVAVMVVAGQVVAGQAAAKQTDPASMNAKQRIPENDLSSAQKSTSHLTTTSHSSDRAIS